MAWNALRSACSLLALALALPLGAAAETPAPKPAPRPPVVAVVDISRVLRSSKEWRDSAERRTRLLEKMRVTLGKLSHQAQVLRNDYENLPPGTEERRNKAAELEKALSELEKTRRQFQAQMAAEQSKALREEFKKITAVVAEYAREHGIDLVLKKADLSLSGPQSPERDLALATTEVLYASAALDISDAIVERLNARYPGPIEVK